MGRAVLGPEMNGYDLGLRANVSNSCAAFNSIPDQLETLVSTDKQYGTPLPLHGNRRNIRHSTH